MYTIVEDSTTEPVTLDEIKSYCQIDSDYTYDDTLLTMLAQGARETMEKETGLAFATKTISFTSTNPSDYPFLPFQSITDPIVESDYADPVFSQVNTDNPTFYPMGFLDTAFNFQKPPVYYTVTYTAGYADGALPKELKHAVLHLTRVYYDRMRNDATGDEKGIRTVAPDAYAMQIAKRFKPNPLF